MPTAIITGSDKPPPPGHHVRGERRCAHCGLVLVRAGEEFLVRCARGVPSRDAIWPGSCRGGGQQQVPFGARDSHEEDRPFLIGVAPNISSSMARNITRSNSRPLALCTVSSRIAVVSASLRSAS